MDKIPTALFTALDRDVTACNGKSVDFYRSCSSHLADFTHTDVCLFNLVHSLPKKFEPSDTKVQDEACLLKFLKSNSLCEMWVDGSETSLDETLVGSFKDVLWRFFNPQGLSLVENLDDAFLLGRCGPGASLMTPNGDFYSKMFSSRLTTSSRTLVSNYERNVRRWPEWKDAEQTRNLSFGSPCIVEGSRLSFVPKNDRISRSICTEPTLNMFYQLGLAEILTNRLRSFFGIDLANQAEVNRDMARDGSLYDSWCTIDLESASDSISLKMCRAFLPKDVLAILETLRSPSTSYNGSAIELHMMSSMGNGFTFPLQTIIFCSIVKAVYTSLGIPLVKRSSFETGPRNFGVFGDDLIIAKNAWHRVVRLLGLLGFRVNTEKSFYEGPFRESCGRDFLLGRNVRGVYPRRLDSEQDFYALINLISDFSARTGIVLSSVMNYLLKRVDRSVEIPPWEDASSGIRLPLSLVKTKRVCSCRRSSCRFHTHSILYEKWVNVARKISIRESSIDRIRGRRILYNESGLLIAFLSGMALSSGLPVRQNVGEENWKKKRASCSMWDTLPSDAVIRDGISWQRFETAVYLNLNRY